MAETAYQSQNMFGEKLYQIRARKALPILVRQSLSRNPIFYEALATELEMPNPRNLNYVLGSVGKTLEEMNRDRRWGKIPQIQSLVINQQQKLPGEGFDSFLAERMGEYQRLTTPKKRAYLDAYWHQIYAYPLWMEILDHLGLKAFPNDAPNIIERAKAGKSGGGGEGEEHRKLKEYVAENPHALNLSSRFGLGTIESSLPSGDKIDVLFTTEKSRVAVEVKSHISNEVDLVRGLFQCVKYRAVMLAERGFVVKDYSIEAILVVGNSFPERLAPLRNRLGVQTIEIIR